MWFMPRSRKENLKEIHQFYIFLPQHYLPFGWRSWNLQFLVSLPYRCYTPNLVKIGPVVLEKKMLRVKSDSGDLKIPISKKSYIKTYTIYNPAKIPSRPMRYSISVHWQTDSEQSKYWSTESRPLIIDWFAITFENISLI